MFKSLITQLVGQICPVEQFTRPGTRGTSSGETFSSSRELCSVGGWASWGVQSGQNSGNDLISSKEIGLVVPVVITPISDGVAKELKVFTMSISLSPQSTPTKWKSRLSVPQRLSKSAAYRKLRPSGM